MQDFFLSFHNDEQQNDSIFPTLTLKERLIGFAVCFGLGFLFQFMAAGSIIGMLFGKASKFAFLYTCGNLISVFGTFFLIGPKRQFLNMTDPYRKNSSLVFIFSMLLTFISVYLIKSNLLTILFVIIQFGAYCMYIASYIPYGRECIKWITKKVSGINIGGN